MLYLKPGVARERVDSDHAAADRMYDVHPQVARLLSLTEHEEGVGMPQPSNVLRFMLKQVLNRTEPNVPVYGNGPLEHGPHPSLSAPDPRCRRAVKGKCKLAKDGVSCKSRYPFEPTPFSYVGENGFVFYQRDDGDEFIVPYNPWMLLDIRVHVNVEFAASSECITYLYKYLFKVPRVLACLSFCASRTPAHSAYRAARAQASRGDRMRYQLATADQETIDETREYWEGKVTSSAEAWWRAYS